MMMDDGAVQIAPVIVPVIEGLGFEIVRLSFFAGNLQIMAEQPDGTNIGIDDCGTLSRAIAAKMDEADPIADAYTLEISSPGIDRPLTRQKDFVRWAGFEARLETLTPIDGQSKFKGKILGCDNGIVTLRDEAGADKKIEFAALRRAKLVLTDELLAAHKRAA
jgi:ribosome maturation factor RimP